MLRATAVLTLLAFAACGTDDVAGGDGGTDASTSADSHVPTPDGGSDDAELPDSSMPPSDGGPDTSVVDPGLPAPTIFSDGFETGDLSATNARGFRWAGTNRTSIVTEDPDDGSVAVFNGEEIYNIADAVMPDGTPRDWTAVEGDYSMRFRYPAGEPWAEQRFDLGTPERDLWVRFWVRVPLNYVHGPMGSPARNQKFLSIWMDGYSGDGDGSTTWLGFHPSGDGSDSTLAVTYSEGGHTSSIAYQQSRPFITSSTDRGRWMQVVFHIRAETSPGASDGILETWRRWEDEEGFTKLHEVFDARLKVAESGPAGFQRGYLLGWANGHYAVDTEWLLDLFEVSDAPLVPGY